MRKTLVSRWVCHSHRRAVGAVAWALVTSAIAAALILGGALLLGTDGGQSEVVATPVAFVVTTLGGSALVSRLGPSG